jgi:RNase P subunit RPR2
MNCAFCDRPLVCDACDTPWQPADEVQFRAMEQREVPVYCAECEQILVCHWCKTPYDGLEEDASDGAV